MVLMCDGTVTKKNYPLPTTKKASYKLKTSVLNDKEYKRAVHRRNTGGQ